jgi:hypothetical protein
MHHACHLDVQLRSNIVTHDLSHLKLSLPVESRHAERNSSLIIVHSSQIVKMINYHRRLDELDCVFFLSFIFCFVCEPPFVMEEKNYCEKILI